MLDTATRCLLPQAQGRPLAQAPCKIGAHARDRPTQDATDAEKTKQIISHQLLHRPRHVAFVDVLREAERVLGIKRGVRRN